MSVKDNPLKVNDVCPECNEYMPEDERVQAGMKCGFCAYGVCINEDADDSQAEEMSLTDVMSSDTIMESKPKENE